jgi:DNA-directed RNA polymerase specialized sigma24 family protein
MTKYAPITIPSNNDFLKTWHNWISHRVSLRFKRDKFRIPDIAQDVRCRLLAKDFIGRWFYRHLTDDVLDIEQASKILNLDKKNLSFISSVPVANGVKRGSPDALWRVSDILKYARFDYARYYYSIQRHTIASDKVLRLLGYDRSNFNSLASLYRQGRLYPSELTEHNCTGDKSCQECEKGRASLYRRNLSLAHDWQDPAVEADVLRLRWNDSQLEPFLRNWKKNNRIVCTPSYIMRPVGDRGIDAGLLKYTDIVIKNTVANRFKQLGRTDDTKDTVKDEEGKWGNTRLNGGRSAEFSTNELVVWESTDDETQNQRVYRDMMSSEMFETFERRYDVSSIMNRAGLDSSEQSIVTAVEMQEMSVGEFANANAVSVVHARRAHKGAMQKLRQIADWDEEDYNYNEHGKEPCSLPNTL